MKPYGVVLFNSRQLTDFNAGGPRDTFLLAYQALQFENDGAVFMDQRQLLYFTDTRAQAEALAVKLCETNPQNEYIVFKSEEFFRRPPQELVRTKFTEKGLLP